MSLPITPAQAKKAVKWLKDNFEKVIENAVKGTPWTVDLICGIACQETAYKWLRWIDKYSADIVCARCVFDASGDFPNTSRSAFPKNRAAFEAVYGKDLAAMLVNEANKARSMPQSDAPNGYSPSTMLYKGYGIFQNDLQNIKTDESFFREKKWYSFEECLKQVIRELNSKAKIHDNLQSIVKAYNGSGPKADVYSQNVMQFIEYSASV